MKAAECLSFVVNEIHTTVVATVDDEGLPVTAAIDMMDCDENSLYFLTAKGKGFYDRLIKRWFDLSKKPIERASFTFGGAAQKPEGYFITDACIGCGSCATVCPQNCINTDSIPYGIEQDHCLHCGNCIEACPVGAVERR